MSCAQAPTWALSTWSSSRHANADCRSRSPIRFIRPFSVFCGGSDRGQPSTAAATTWSSERAGRRPSNLCEIVTLQPEASRSPPVAVAVAHPSLPSPPLALGALVQFQVQRPKVQTPSLPPSLHPSLSMLHTWEGGAGIPQEEGRRGCRAVHAAPRRAVRVIMPTSNLRWLQTAVGRSVEGVRRRREIHPRNVREHSPRFYFVDGLRRFPGKGARVVRGGDNGVRKEPGRGRFHRSCILVQSDPKATCSKVPFESLPQCQG